MFGDHRPSADSMRMQIRCDFQVHVLPRSTAVCSSLIIWSIQTTTGSSKAARERTGRRPWNESGITSRDAVHPGPIAATLCSAARDGLGDPRSGGCNHVRQKADDREAIRRVLEIEQVRKVAEGAGLDLRRAETAVAALDDAEAGLIAAQARAVNAALAGGQSTVTISTTVIIIGLLVLILLIVAI